ncbi:MAG: hypothetical protein HQL51_14505 [Magnetococcales bacterium]|nr:hypothetical protein [Magnetococcales bacterium]
MVLMVLIMGLAAALVDHFLVSEAREVEKSLAKVRLYWAATGNVNYVLARTYHYLTANGVNAGTNPTIGNYQTKLSEFILDTGSATACPYDPVTSANQNLIPLQINCFFRELDTAVSGDASSNNTTVWKYLEYTDGVFTLPLRFESGGVSVDGGNLTRFKVIADGLGSAGALEGFNTSELPLHYKFGAALGPKLLITRYFRAD